MEYASTEGRLIAVVFQGYIYCTTHIDQQEAIDGFPFSVYSLDI